MSPQNMNWDYYCKFNHEMINYESISTRNRDQYKLLKRKVGHEDFAKSEISIFTQLFIKPVTLTQSAIECFFEETLTHKLCF